MNSGGNSARKDWIPQYQIQDRLGQARNDMRRKGVMTHSSTMLRLKHVQVTIVFGLFRRSDYTTDMGCGLPYDIASGWPDDRG
ncbi:MAG: hypothetical protein QG552_2706 [Thermodesulfobacteriota bacterium]|nr:hypothetical protein [Thermodesulfobacteriota bacterium]